MKAILENVKKNNTTLSTEELAHMAVNVRNAFVSSARNSIYDKRAFTSLELDQPLWNYRYLESKYAKEGYSGEALNKKVIEDSYDQKSLTDAMKLRNFDGIDDDLLYQVAQEMETPEAREMREVVEQGGCFPAGTRVITDKGLVHIQDIQVGDQVLSKPESGEGELCYKPVVRNVSYENKELWELWYFEIKANTNLSKLHKGKLLQLSRKGKLRGIAATPNHPFGVKGVEWTRLDQLEQGQLIEMQNSDNVALVFMVNPLRKTTHPNVAASSHVRNIFDADRKGFDIDDVEYFDFLEYDQTGLLCGIVDSDIPSPCYVNDQAVHVLPDVFCQTVYNFEVANYHTYFITDDGLWVHNTNCAEATLDLLPKNLVTRTGNSVPTKDVQGIDINVYTNKASVYVAYNGVKNGEGGIAIIKRAIANDTGKNGKVLPSVIFDRGAPNALFDKAVGSNENYEYILIGQHPDFIKSDGHVNNKYIIM